MEVAILKRIGKVFLLPLVENADYDNEIGVLLCVYKTGVWIIPDFSCF